MTKTWQQITSFSSDPLVLGRQLCPGETPEEQLRAITTLSMVNTILAKHPFAYVFTGAYLGLVTGENIQSNYDLAEYMWQTLDTTKTLIIVEHCLQQLTDSSDVEYIPVLSSLGDLLAREGLKNVNATAD